MNTYASHLLSSFHHRLARSCYCKKLYISTKHIIDLRSDTLTKPSEEMLQVMMEADVGDDVYKENITVNRLEEQCARLFGMEDALFVPSGTMGNLISVMSHVRGRGEGLIVGSTQHLYGREQGGISQYGSVQAFVVPNNPDGTMSIEDIARYIYDDSDFHSSQTKLVCLENTHMRAGGIPLSVDYMHQVGHLARSNNVAVHVDGARLYNAAVSLNCKVADLLSDADSVSMCISKGLGCPIGSVIGGTRDFIREAARIRKALGGEMHQSGFLAAAGLYALENAWDVLSADHEKALDLARGIQDLNCRHLVNINIKDVRTNILLMKTGGDMAYYVAQKLNERGVLCRAFDSSTIRFVMHRDISSNDVGKVLEAIRLVVQELSLKSVL